MNEDLDVVLERLETLRAIIDRLETGLTVGGQVVPASVLSGVATEMTSIVCDMGAAVARLSEHIELGLEVEHD